MERDGTFSAGEREAVYRCIHERRDVRGEFRPDPVPDAVLAHPRVTQCVRLPMLPGRRSLNLTNAASVAIYEAWRQLGFSA